MGDHSKREKSRQNVIEALDCALASEVRMPRCHCGAPAKYEVNRGTAGIEFYCAEHLPPDALER